MKKFLFREYFFQSKESIHNVFKEYYPEFFVEQQDAL